MKKCYINGIGVISTQKFVEHSFTEDLKCVSENLNFAQYPDYKEIISANLLRRMSSAVKMGIFSGLKALQNAKIFDVDAIIVGTGLGCLSDSEKFLKNMIDNEEEFLTPTAFIQSTHNTVAAQIALQLKSKAYNFTYVNGGNSFESALLDGLMQIQSEESSKVLVGGIDEIAQRTHELYQLINVIKSTNNSVGARFAEGSTFFALSSKKNDETFAEIVDVKIINSITPNEIELFVIDFLKENQLDLNFIDAFLIGKNDDERFDSFYDFFLQNETKTVGVYKAFSGEYETASAYGLAIASEILKTQNFPSILKINQNSRKEFNYILLYNQFNGINHSLVLIKKC